MAETWKVGGDYANQSYSTLSKINKASVKTLGRGSVAAEISRDY